MEDMTENIHIGDCDSLCWIIPEFESKFSIEKFCYYLLSPEFIKKYARIRFNQTDDPSKDCTAEFFWQAIYEYQKGNKEPLNTLLSK